MTATEIRADLPIVAPAYFADASYAKPTLRWLLSDFWEWFEESRWRLGLLKWERRNDCDNFARAYCQAAADCHALSTGQSGDGLAVGEYWYQSPNGPHAVVVAYTDVGRVFVEPQSGKQLFLLPQEVNSCFFARF